MTETLQPPTRTYELKGRLLEACDCNVLCPCWIGEDPDGGSCDTVVAWVWSIRIGSGINPVLEADMASYMGATEKPTVLQETVFSTIPGVREQSRQVSAELLSLRAQGHRPGKSQRSPGLL